MIIGPIEHKTNIRFEKMDDFESFINAIGIDYDSEDVAFTGYVFKLDTPQFKVVERSAYAKGTNCMQEIVECHGRNCCIPTDGHCFKKCIKYFTRKDCTEDISTSIRSKNYGSGLMTPPRIQPFCRKKTLT